MCNAVAQWIRGDDDCIERRGFCLVRPWFTRSLAPIHGRTRLLQDGTAKVTGLSYSYGGRRLL
jgi:hypothetical protein